MQSVSGKVVVITGASLGIGCAIAKLFAAQGARLVLSGRNKKRLEDVARSLQRSNSDILSVTADISKPAGMKKITDAAYKKFKRIDIFINNAGVGIKKPIEKMTEQEFDQIFDTNLKAVYRCFRLVLPRMRKQGGGQIINISSGASRDGLPEMAAYSASKAALNILSEAVAGEVRNDNIKVSVLAPGSTETNFRWNMTKSAKRNRGHKSSTGSVRKLTVEEVAEAVLALASQNENAWTSIAHLRPLVIGS